MPMTDPTTDFVLPSTQSRRTFLTALAATAAAVVSSRALAVQPASGSAAKPIRDIVV